MSPPYLLVKTPPLHAYTTLIMSVSNAELKAAVDRRFVLSGERSR
jgi:hypothetical protein